MNQSFYPSEEFEHTLTGVKSHQCRDILLCIDEILTALDTASPAVEQWKAARKFVQLLEVNKFAAMRRMTNGAANGEQARECA